MNECVVCGSKFDGFLGFEWTIFHGTAACKTCGVTYLLKDYNGRVDTICTMTEESIAIIKEYWEKTKHHMWFSYCETEQQISDSNAVKKWTMENYPQHLKKSEE